MGKVQGDTAKMESPKTPRGGACWGWVGHAERDPAHPWAHTLYPWGLTATDLAQLGVLIFQE